jgi:prepilin-type processing-associated H-X9-DG protein
MVGDRAASFYGASKVMNGTVTVSVVNAYLCPSDPDVGGTDTIKIGTVKIVVADTNYPINGGTNRQNNGGYVNGVSWWLGGNPVYGKMVTLAAVTDGTTNTALFSEWVKGRQDADLDGPSLVYNTITSYSNGGPQADYSVCQNAPYKGLTSVWDDKGEVWTLQDTNRGGPYYHVLPPNGKSCATTQDFGIIDSFVTAGSWHPGGANVLFLDGSVKLIKESVNLQTWLAIATIAGGEVLSADSF